MEHNAHVELLRSHLHQFISDVSKDAQGWRHRIDPSQYTIAELEAECSYWAKQSEIAEREEAAREKRAIEKFEEDITRIMNVGAHDRATALRWFRDAHFADDEWGRMYGDEKIRYDLGLPWNYDLDHGDCLLFERMEEAA